MRHPASLTEAIPHTTSESILDEQAILAEVRCRTSLDFADETSLGDRLSRLLFHFDNELGLDEAGKRAAHDTIVNLLGSRAQLLADRKRYPTIADEVIERPLMVTGLPRSGTTLLHSLLAADPANRSPQGWEALRPSPPPGISAADDPRIGQSDREVAELIKLQPRMLQSHPYFDQGGRALMECEGMGVTDLRHILRSVFYRVPGIPAIDLNTNPVEFYQYHRMLLQALQWQREPRRWALKGTEHHVRLEALKSVYPDAIVIWLHRDPQKVFPSVMELLTSLYEGVAGTSFDRQAFGRKVMTRYKAMLDAAMSSSLLDHPDVYHLRYADFGAGAIEQIERIYQRYGIAFTPETRAAMCGWYESPSNKGDRHGKFTYSLASFGVTGDQIEEETRAYRQRFDIPLEEK